MVHVASMDRKGEVQLVRPAGAGMVPHRASIKKHGGILVRPAGAGMVPLEPNELSKAMGTPRKRGRLYDRKGQVAVGRVRPAGAGKIRRSTVLVSIGTLGTPRRSGDGPDVGRRDL